MNMIKVLMENKNLLTKNNETEYENISNWILNFIKENDKKEKLKKACRRNASMTSSYQMSYMTIKIYKEGYYVTFEGTRTATSFYISDTDGELKIENRKPLEKKLSLLYSIWTDTNEDDYEVA